MRGGGGGSDGVGGGAVRCVRYENKMEITFRARGGGNGSRVRKKKINEKESNANLRMEKKNIILPLAVYFMRSKICFALPGE